jgi:hypothetical protein
MLCWVWPGSGNKRYVPTTLSSPFILSPSTLLDDPAPHAWDISALPEYFQVDAGSISSKTTHMCVLIKCNSREQDIKILYFFLKKDRPIVCRGSESKFKIYLASISREKYHVLPLHPCCCAFIKSGPTISHGTKKAK